MSETKGRRVYLNEETKPHDLEPGDYMKMADGKWILRTPSGYLGRISPEIHKIVEHEDGTITVSPSIGFLGRTGEPGFAWHGYLERGVWRSC